MSDIDVLVSEVGPRDGLQSIDAVMPTAKRRKPGSAAEAAAGVREIEVASFVPPKLLPQMADAAEIVEHATDDSRIWPSSPSYRTSRAPRTQSRRARDKLGLPLSCSETHSQANLNKTHDQVIDEVRKIADLLGTLPADERPSFEGSLSTAFGCTLEGEVPEDQVVRLAARLVEAGVDELSLSDTTGYANPNQLRRLIRLVRAEVGEDKLDGVHLHNTRGLGLANVVAALEEGITTVDSSLGGIGGCPFAPGASGNIVTEDLVFMLDSMGLKTGIDLDKLLQVRDVVIEALPGEEMYGFTPDAGLPKGYAGPGWGIA